MKFNLNKSSFRSFMNSNKVLILKNERIKWMSAIFWILLVVGTVVLITIGWTTMQQEMPSQLSNQTGPEDFIHYGGVEASYGGVAMYPIFITSGMFAAVAFSAWKFYKKGLNITQLSLGVIFIIPASLLGASFFGKLSAIGPGINADNVNFWGLFAFWEPGLSIHGGVYAGLIVGLVIFYFVGKKTKVSLLVYGDAIVPNILLGQAIGRWGNFFNHELTGVPVYNYGQGSSIADAAAGSSSGIHLPDWLLFNTSIQYKDNGYEDWFINGQKVMDGDYIQLSPIFFYESVALLALWVVITFIIPNIGKWLGNKPWKINTDIHVDWKFTTKQFFMPWLKSTENSKSYRDIWDEEYYNNVNEKAKAAYYKNVDNMQGQNIVVEKWKKTSALIAANNPYNYSITKSGVELCAYFFGWNLVRFMLELQRNGGSLFIMHQKDLSLAVILISAIVGLIGMILCVYIIPKLTRRTGYMYEKDYFRLVKID